MQHLCTQLTVSVQIYREGNYVQNGSLKLGLTYYRIENFDFYGISDKLLADIIQLHDSF